MPTRARAFEGARQRRRRPARNQTVSRREALTAHRCSQQLRGNTTGKLRRTAVQGPSMMPAMHDAHSPLRDDRSRGQE